MFTKVLSSHMTVTLITQHTDLSHMQGQYLALSAGVRAHLYCLPSEELLVVVTNMAAVINIH